MPARASADPASIREVVSGFDARLFRLERTGAARARNFGIRQARGEIIAFTDDDASVGPEWLDALASGFSNPAVSAVVGPVFELASEPARLLFPSAGFDAGSDRVSLSRSDPTWFEKLRSGAFGFGANLAVRRAVFKRHGLFRECLGAGAPIGGDENYFLLALIENGGLVV
ncbi:MAG: glycosyltransferase, partial [Terracidiphilus sp.]